MQAALGSNITVFVDTKHQQDHRQRVFIKSMKNMHDVLSHYITKQCDWLHEDTDNKRMGGLTFTLHHNSTKGVNVLTHLESSATQEIARRQVAAFPFHKFVSSTVAKLEAESSVNTPQTTLDLDVPLQSDTEIESGFVTERRVIDENNELNDVDMGRSNDDNYVPTDLASFLIHAQSDNGTNWFGPFLVYEFA